MVNATVDNDPVSIVLDGAQSTTVPSNETWKVSIYLGQENQTVIQIDGIGDFEAAVGSSTGAYRMENVVLTGGQTITEIRDEVESVIFITGFVVNS